MRRALIIGCLGQDGTLLYKLLIRKGYQVIGIDVNYIKASYGYMRDTVVITNKDQIARLIRLVRPTEIYHLAAFHHSSEDNEHSNNEKVFKKSFEVNTFSLFYILEAIRQCGFKSRLFYAASSHIFENKSRLAQDELSYINPSSIYGITKSAGLFICRYYREKYSLFVSCGVLYNHESILRRENFISKKIIKGAIAIKKGKQDKLVLGNTKSKVDWGYAPDYVDAMYRILKLNDPDDFVIATGEKHSVAEFAKLAFEYFGLNWRNYVEENRNILVKNDSPRVGNARKLRLWTGWKPSISFKEMVGVLIKEQVGLASDCSKLK